MPGVSVMVAVFAASSTVASWPVRETSAVVVPPSPAPRALTSSVGTSSIGTTIEDDDFAPDALVLPVVVTGSTLEHALEDTPVATEVITRKRIAESGGRSVAEVLSRERGIDVTQTFRGRGAAVRIHGLDPKHVLVLVDGERMVGRIDGSIDLSRIPAERVERIEIVKGAGSAIYGSEAMGGTVHIVTRKPFRAFEADLAARVGTLEALDLTAHAATKQSAFDADVVFGQHQRAAYDLDPDDVATNGSAYEHTELSGRFAVPLGSGAEVVALLDYALRATEGVDANPDTGAVFDRNSSTLSLSGSIGARVPLGEASKVGGSLRAPQLRASVAGAWFFDQFRLDQRSVEDADPVAETRDVQGVARTQLDLTVGSAQVISAGVEGLIESTESGDRIGGEHSRRRVAIFIQDEWTPTTAPRLNLVPGGRLDVDSQFGVHPSPKLAARFDPMKGLALRAGFGLGFRAPDFKELFLAFANQAAGYYVAGNSELEPETSTSLSLGAEWSAAKRTSLSLELFRNDLSNLIETVSARAERCPAGFGLCFIYENIAEAHTQGAEVGAEVQVARGFSFLLGYAFTDTRDERLDRPLEGRATHRLTFGTSILLDSLGTSGIVRGALVGPRPFYTDSAGNPLPDGRKVDASAYLALDARIAQRLFGFLELSAGIDNILDSGEIGYLPIQPRSVWAGLEVKLPE